MSTVPTITYTLTDEAPLLATHAFLPIARTFTTPAGVSVEESDISVAARILGIDRRSLYRRLDGDTRTTAAPVPARTAEGGRG